MKDPDTTYGTEQKKSKIASCQGVVPFVHSSFASSVEADRASALRAQRWIVVLVVVVVLVLVRNQPFILSEYKDPAIGFISLWLSLICFRCFSTAEVIGADPVISWERTNSESRRCDVGRTGRVGNLAQEWVRRLITPGWGVPGTVSGSQSELAGVFPFQEVQTKTLKIEKHKDLEICFLTFAFVTT